MSTLTQAVLYTDAEGYARFRDEAIELPLGTPAARLSELRATHACQFRVSPVGFRSDFHCTEAPQWTVVLAGAMEIGLRDGSTRLFRAGAFFYSSDLLPAGAEFDAGRHGHCSRQVGDVPLVTLFVKV